jgi:hypothetical protein
VSLWTDAAPFFRQRFAEALDDDCTITRITVRGTFNDVTGRYSTPVSSTVYAGPCLLRPAEVAPVERGEAEVTVGRYDVYLPHDADGIGPEDVVTLTSCSLDPGVVDVPLRVVDVSWDGLNSRRRVEVTADLGRGSP